VKKNVVIIGLYLPGIYPKGDDSVVVNLLAPAVLKATADADSEISAQYEIKILSFPTTIDSEKLAQVICAQDPFIIAYSVYIWNYYHVSENVRCVKKIRPEAKIVFGGPQVAYTSVKVLEENPEVDIVVCGSGETRFKLLLKSGLRLGELSKIPSITYRDKDKKIVSTEGVISEDLSQIPSLYQSKIIDLNDGSRHTVFLETFRSCPFKCGYCAWGNGDSNIRLFPIEQILKDIEIIYNNPNVEAVIVVDACIYYQSRERVKKIIDKIASCSRKIPTVFTLDIHLLDEQLIEYLSKIELGDVWCFGLQSVNPSAIKLMGRKTDRKIFIKKTELLRRVKPSAETSFNIIYGLPGDNYAAFRETIDFALSLRPIKLQIYPLLLLPGSPFWYNRVEYGFKYDDNPPYMVYSNRHYSEEDMEKTLHFSLWYLAITYFPAIRDAIFSIPDCNPKFSRVDLIDQFIENMKEKIDPITDLRNKFVNTIENFNAIRRQVFNFLFEPENCLYAYKSMLKLLDSCGVQQLSENILIGIDYYTALTKEPDEHEQKDAFFVQKYGKKKIEYVKSTWVRPFKFLKGEDA